MKKIATPKSLFTAASARVYFGLFVGVGFAVFGLVQSATAQSTAIPNALEDFRQQDNPDPFSNRGNGQASGIFDLVHRAVLGPSRGLDEYSTEQRENLDTAASEFRAKQQQLLQTQGQTSSTTPAAVTPEGSTPAVTTNK